MANLFEYNTAIDEIMAKAIDENGVVIDEELIAELDCLEMERKEKIDNIISFYKSRKAMADALKAEKKAIGDRQKTAENECESIKRYLGAALAGSKWESTAGKISYRASKELHIDDESHIPEEYMRVKKEPNKTAIKDAILKDGEIIDGVWVEDKTNTIIK